MLNNHYSWSTCESDEDADRSYSKQFRVRLRRLKPFASGRKVGGAPPLGLTVIGGRHSSQALPNTV